jgi:uncharacterized RDD family membrane protein YckC
MSTEKPAADPLSWLSYGRKRKPSEYDKYATFNRRMLAATLDSMLLMFFAPIFDQIIPIDRSGLANIVIQENQPASQLFLAVISDRAFISSWVNNFLMQMTVFLFYSAVCWHFWSATPGKMVLRLRIADAKTLKPVSDLQILLRVMGYMISGFTFFLGFFWIGLNKKKRGWHDYLADTVVVAEPWKLTRSLTPRETPPENMPENMPENRPETAAAPSPLKDTETP